MEAELYYFCKPTKDWEHVQPIDFLSVTDFLTHESLCKPFWELISSQFKTRSKFLQIWPNVRYVALARNETGQMLGFLLVTASINWQIDYVTVTSEARGKKLASSLVKATLNEAKKRNVPYVMLSSREGLRPLYEGECGFTVVGTRDA